MVEAVVWHLCKITCKSVKSGIYSKKIGLILYKQVRGEVLNPF